MLSKNQLKHIKSLANKKQRKLSKTFLVQGEKNILELLHSSLEIEALYISDNFEAGNGKIIKNQEYQVVSKEQLTQASTISTNNDAIAIVRQPEFASPTLSGLTLALDDINDPGNLGTIIRLADWFGITDILISEKTADVYNPKTISATMGAFTRVKTHRVNLREFLQTLTMPVYGAFLEGENVHETSFSLPSVIVMGNESHGISESVERAITKKITIPSFGNSESLNVAMATGIILDNARRSLS